MHEPSYAMLTINADTHPLMHQFHKPTDEKRMVVILAESEYGDWLDTPPERSTKFLHPYPADKLIAEAISGTK